MKKKYSFLLALFFALSSLAYNGTTRFTIPNNLQSSVFNTNLSQVELDNSGKVLITSSGAGLISFDGISYANFNTTNSSIASNFIKDVAVDGSNNYYAVSDSGMSVYNGVAWTNYSPSNSQIISKSLKCVYAKNSMVYVGGNNGFSIYNNGVFTNYTSTNSALSNDTIYDFCTDSNNDLWIATNDGLCKLSGNVITVYNTARSNIIISVLANGSEIWFVEDLGGINTLYRLQNNVISEISELVNTPIPFRIGRGLCKSPNGGILFTNHFNIGEICEFYQNRIKTYFLNDFLVILNPYSSYMVFNASTNTVWIPGYSKNFFSLQFNNYQNTIAGYSPIPIVPVTFENCKSIDINNVNAAMLNIGDMFWNTDNVKCEIPKNSGKHSVFANSLWIGGVDASNNLRVAAQTYRQSGIDYWPGPLDTITGSTDTAKAAQYNKIWKVSRFDIEQFKYNFLIGTVQNGSFIPTDDILTWPARDVGNYSRNMAPFVDVNQDGIYNPLSGGDYPLIKGDQMLYWIFNDNLAIHTESDGLPLKVEIHASAYAFACPSLQTRDSILNYTTFYNYKIFNRSNQTYDSCYLANWTDYDLGDPADDLYGSNPMNNFVYCYNGDSIDISNGNNNYGANPPIMSNVILNGPIAYTNDSIDNNNNGTIDEPNERNLMTNTIFYENNFTLTGNPQISGHYYNYLKGKWKDNLPLTLGGNGHTGSIPQKFIWPDFPYVANAWAQTTPTDGRIVQACGPFQFSANSSIEYDYAFIYSRDTTLAYNSQAYYSMALSDVQRVKSWFDNNNAPSCLPIFPGITEQSNQTNNLLLFPNPSNNSIQIQFNNSSIITDLSIYDVMGKCVLESIPRAQAKSVVKIDVNKFSPGVYIVSAKDYKGTIHHKKFIRE